MCVKFISEDYLWETFLWKLPLPYHVRIAVIFSMYYFYFKDKSTALPSNLINSIIQEHKCKKHLSYGTIFLKFPLQFSQIHRRLVKGKVLKHFGNFKKEFCLKFRLSLCSKDYNSPLGLKKGIYIQLRETFSKSPSRMSPVHVLAV